MRDGGGGGGGGVEGRGGEGGGKKNTSIFMWDRESVWSDVLSISI